MHTPMREDEYSGGGRRAVLYKNPEMTLGLDRIAERGWTALMWPTQHPGGDLSKEEYQILQTELRRINAEEIERPFWPSGQVAGDPPVVSHTSVW